MRTSVRIGPRPWRLAQELEGALDRGDLRYAKTLAAELRIDQKPVPLDLAAKFLPPIAREDPEQYDAWAR